MRKEQPANYTSEELINSMETDANRFNLKCLAVLSGFSVLCAVCNHIGIFTVDPGTMRIAVITAVLSFCTPILFWLAYDKLIGILHKSADETMSILREMSMLSST